MGMFDRIQLEEGVDLPKFPDHRSPTDLEWQTKDIGMPSMQTYKLTADGRLLRQEVEYREKTDEEKQNDAEEHGFSSWEEYTTFAEEASPDEMMQLGVIGPPRSQTVDERFWLDHNMHGSFEFHASDDDAEVGEGDGFFWSYEARFTKGELEAIVFLGERGSGDPNDVKPEEPAKKSF